MKHVVFVYGHIINYGRGGGDMLVGGSPNSTTPFRGDHQIPGAQNGGITKFTLNGDHKIDFDKESSKKNCGFP